MTRETAAAKGRRLLAEGRLTVVRVDGVLADAVCQGDNGIYHLGHDPARGWHCTCRPGAAARILPRSAW